MTRLRQRRHKCVCCKSWFVPDPRKRRQQKYCSKKQCQRASKATSQQRWLHKAQNECYFRGPEHVDRVQRWRRAHPQYWRKKKDHEGPALQDVIDTQPIEAADKSAHENWALQDVMVKLPRRRLQRQVGHRGLRAGVQRVDQTGPCR
jgi:hypothetical protein